MSLRLDLTNPAHRKFLEKRVGKDTLKQILNPEGVKRINHRLDQLEMIEMTESSRNNDRNKYGNIKTLDLETNKVFDSKWELEVYRMFLNLQDKKLVSEVQSTDIVTLVVNDHTICDFELDYSFVYRGKKYWADAKSKATLPQGFKIKQKLFEVLFETKLFLIFRGKESVIDKISKGETI